MMVVIAGLALAVDDIVVATKVPERTVVSVDDVDSGAVAVADEAVVVMVDVVAAGLDDCTFTQHLTSIGSLSQPLAPALYDMNDKPQLACFVHTPKLPLKLQIFGLFTQHRKSEAY